MNLLGILISICVLIGITTCSVGLMKETDRATQKQCYEQTKNEKCWNL